MDETAKFVRLACIGEAKARKIGNVHPDAAFADMTFDDFVKSADAISPLMTGQLGVGQKILAAVTATQHAVGKNTNLGIILLLAPLCDPRPIADVLNSLTIDDARLTFEAIRLAKPGGLGEAKSQDIHDAPTVTLKEAMALAADRDLIARQYTNHFADVFGFGLEAFQTAFEFQPTVEFAILETQLKLMAEYPDSLILRKNGPAIADDIQARAQGMLAIGGWRTGEGRAAIGVYDQIIRKQGSKLNPGTTADLIAAILFVALRNRIVSEESRFELE